MWLIIRKPDDVHAELAGGAMCWAEMSASVQWVATRTMRAPSA